MFLYFFYICVFEKTQPTYYMQDNVHLSESIEDLPDELILYNGGFSCKSFSRLHPDFASLQKALHQNNEDILQHVVHAYVPSCSIG